MIDIDDIYTEIMKQNNTNAHWVDSPYLGFKVLPPKAKGAVGERMVREIFQQKGCVIESPTSSDHDLIVDGRKKEIKMASLTRIEKCGNGNFTFFQVRPNQDYDDLVLVCVHPDRIEVKELSKDILKKFIVENENEMVVAGGKEKRNRLKYAYGDNWMEHNDLYHWLHNTKASYPEGTVSLID